MIGGAHRLLSHTTKFGYTDFSRKIKAVEKEAYLNAYNKILEGYNRTSAHNTIGGIPRIMEYTPQVPIYSFEDAIVKLLVERFGFTTIPHTECGILSMMLEHTQKEMKDTTAELYLEEYYNNFKPKEQLELLVVDK